MGVLLVGFTALFAPWATYTSFALWTTPVTLSVFSLCGLLILLVAAKRKIDLDLQVLLFLCYIALILLSYTWTLVPSLWFYAVFWWSINLISFAGALHFIRTFQHVRILVYLSIAGALIAGLKLQIVSDDWGNVTSRYAVDLHNMNFTSYALAGVVAISLLANSVIRFPTLFRQTLPLAVAGILYFQIQLGSRGGLLSTVAVTLLYVCRNFIPRVFLYSIPVVAMIISLLSTFGFLDAIFLLLGQFNERSSGDLSGRVVIWSQAFAYITEYPLFGIGPNSFAELNFTGSGAHNFFLTVPLETGVFGVVVFIIFFHRFFKQMIGFKNKRLGGYFVAAFSVYWFPIATSGHWETSPYSWIVIALFIRIACIVKDIEHFELLSMARS